MPLGPVTVAVGGGAATPLAFDLDLGSSTQFGSSFNVNSMFQDGYTSGRLSGFNIGADGVVLGRYTNGQSRNLGQIVLAEFANAQGLKPLGNNRWEETSDSGLAIVGTPASGKLGALQSAAAEDSNVDLTAELISMITAQRVYQANAQSIKTQDAVLQTLVNLR
jgi:flagellar hook protein FlgE